jgi:hypothetical protein
VDWAALRGDDVRALGIMRRALVQQDLGAIAAPSASQAVADDTPPDCDYDVRAVVAAPNGLDSRRNRLYSCYGWAQSLMAGLSLR